MRLAACLALLAACSSPRDRLPEIRDIYEQAALDEVRNPVIVIHGILGARLMQHSEQWKPGDRDDTGTQKTVWGAFTSEAVDVDTPEGARAIALPLEISSSVADYDPANERVYASEPLEQIEVGILTQILSVDIYKMIIRALGAGGYVDRVGADPQSPIYADDHYTCFTFFYDWRRDNVANAIQLARFVREKRVEVVRSATAKVERLRDDGSPDASRKADRIERWLERGFRFDIVAHSMGGLIARYYLRYGDQDLPADGSLPRLNWAGSEEVDHLIMVGTPNLGSMDALVNLTEGYQASFILPFFNQAILGSMPSIYQLLPRPRHGIADVDFTDPAVWERNGWGLLSPDVAETLEWLVPEGDRLAVARDYLRWCLRRAERFQAALDVPVASSPSRLSLFAADAEPTLVRVRSTTDDGRRLPEFDGDDSHDHGDGVVARYSAVADERFGSRRRRRLESPIPWHGVTFLSDDHIGLTQNPMFTNNMLYRLLEEPPYRAPPGPRDAPTSRPSR